MSVQNIITQLATLEATIAGVNRAYDETPESINEMPAVINFPEGFTSTRMMAHGVRRTTWTIKAQLFCQRADLPSAESEARPFANLMLTMLDSNVKLNSSCVTSDCAEGKYGEMSLGAGENAPKYLGWEFIITAVEDEAKTFSG